MFTGIIERTGKIVETRAVSGGRRLRVDVGPIAPECALGASVAISGVCLTVADCANHFLAFDVITETLHKSTLGLRKPGDRVNIERSLRVGDRLDGHFVQGHVDGTATVARIDASAAAHIVRLQPDSALLPYVVPKGAIAVDGVSLTVADLGADWFSIALIPTTLERTTLTALSAGDRVNLETDIITRTIVHRMYEMQGARGLTLSTLREAGIA